MKKLLLISFTILSSLAYAQEFKPEVKIGATVFTGWEFNVDNAEFITKLDTGKPDASLPFGYVPSKNQFETSRNSFYLERSYINVTASLTPDLKARVTPDVFSFTDGNGKTQYELGIKFAYLDYIPFKNDNGMSLGFRIGVIPNNWIPTNENYWGYRGFQKTFTDFSWTTSAARSGNTVTKTQSSFFSSADLGAAVIFTAPNGIAEIQGEVLNGNGYRNLSFDNRFKDLMFTAFVHPLQPLINKKMISVKNAGNTRINGISDLTFGGFAYIGKLDKGENYAVNGVQYRRNRFGAMAYLRYNFKKAGFIKIGGEYGVQNNVDPASVFPGFTGNEKTETNPNGFSSYLEFNPPVKSLDEKLMLVARFDNFEPDNPALIFVGFKQQLLLGGLAFKPNKYLMLGVTYQGVTYEDNFVVKYNGSTTKSDGKLLVHGILNF